MQPLQSPTRIPPTHPHPAGPSTDPFMVGSLRASRGLGWVCSPSRGPQGSPGPTPFSSNPRPVLPWGGLPPTLLSACARQCLGRMQTLKGFTFGGPGYLQHDVGGGHDLLSACVPSAQAAPNPVGEGCSPAPPPARCALQAGPLAAWSPPPPEPAVAPTHPTSKEL